MNSLSDLNPHFDSNAEVVSWPSLGTLELEVLRPVRYKASTRF
jgi:hypothetical protein